MRLHAELDDPAHTVGLAGALVNLAGNLDELGRIDEAIEHCERAVGLYRELVEDDNLGVALAGLAGMYCDDGRPHDGLPLVVEATELLTEAAATTPGLLTDLASALKTVARCHRDLGDHAEALAAIEEAVRLLRGLADADPALRPDLAGALTNLGICHRDAGDPQRALAAVLGSAELYRDVVTAAPTHRPDLAAALFLVSVALGDLGHGVGETVPPAEEAVALYAGPAEENPGIRPRFAALQGRLAALYGSADRHVEALAAAKAAVTLLEGSAGAELAAALTALGRCHRDVGEHDDALLATGRAVDLYRVLAAGDPDLVADLAMALSTLAVRYRTLDRVTDALTPGEEAVALYRELADADPAYRPNLAIALYWLGRSLRDVGRTADALTPAAEAVAIDLDAVTAEPARLPRLTTTLVAYQGLLTELGDPDGADAAWETALAAADPAGATSVLLRRAAVVEPGHPAAASWLHTALAGADTDPLVRQVRDQARRHRAADAPLFDAAWGQPLPGWLLVDAALLATAVDWLDSESVERSQEFLEAHPELLDPSSEPALTEALLGADPDLAEGVPGLVAAARADGIEAAFRPAVLESLAELFVNARPAEQRTLVDERAADLFSEDMFTLLSDWSGEDGTGMVRRGEAVLIVAGFGYEDELFDAMEDHTLFPALLRRIATDADNARALAPAAFVANHCARTLATAALGDFFAAVADAIAGDDDAADELAAARAADPSQTGAWIIELAGIGRVHPSVLSLLTVLTAPMGAEPPGTPA